MGRRGLERDCWEHQQQLGEFREDVSPLFRRKQHRPNKSFRWPRKVLWAKRCCFLLLPSHLSDISASTDNENEVKDYLNPHSYASKLTLKIYFPFPTTPSPTHPSSSPFMLPNLFFYYFHIIITLIWCRFKFKIFVTESGLYFVLVYSFSYLL